MVRNEKEQATNTCNNICVSRKRYAEDHKRGHILSKTRETLGNTKLIYSDRNSGKDYANLHSQKANQWGPRVGDLSGQVGHYKGTFWGGHQECFIS